MPIPAVMNNLKSCAAFGTQPNFSREYAAFPAALAGTKDLFPFPGPKGLRTISTMSWFSRQIVTVIFPMLNPFGKSNLQCLIARWAYQIQRQVRELLTKSIKFSLSNISPISLNFNIAPVHHKIRAVFNLIPIGQFQEEYLWFIRKRLPKIFQISGIVRLPSGANKHVQILSIATFTRTVFCQLFLGPRFASGISISTSAGTKSLFRFCMNTLNFPAERANNILRWSTTQFAQSSQFLKFFYMWILLSLALLTIKSLCFFRMVLTAPCFNMRRPRTLMGAKNLIGSQFAAIRTGMFWPYKWHHIRSITYPLLSMQGAI